MTLLIMLRLLTAATLTGWPSTAGGPGFRSWLNPLAGIQPDVVYS